MLANSLPTLVGLLAGCLSTSSLVPQVLKCWREGLTEAVSKKMFATRAFGLVLWCVYGFFAGSLPVVIFQFALSAYDDWRRLAWTGALLIALAVLSVTIVARLLAREPRRS